MVNRRSFLKSSAVLSSAMLLPLSQGFAGANVNNSNLKLLQLGDALDESYWQMVRSFFAPKTDLHINLENGYFSAQPQNTLNTFKGEVSRLNEEISFYMRELQSGIISEAKNELSNFSDIPVSEFVICRNTTEALDTVIHGYPWQKGDEVVLSKQDYGSMQAAFEQEAKRHGIKLKYIQIPLNPSSDEELVEVYEKALSKKTRMVLLTHLINLTGQILPVKKISSMVHSYGAEVMLDAAHSFAHVQFSVRDLDVDYMGTSLHKWLCCPLGLGMLYMKKEKIHKIWPLFGDDQYEENDIRKFEHHGTRPVSAIASIKRAIEFHNAIGSDRKENRLRFLKQYWWDKTKHLSKFIPNTPENSYRSCAISNFSVKGLSPNELAKTLVKDYNIFTVAINSPEVNGVRVTPHLYTNTQELDSLVNAVTDLCS